METLKYPMPIDTMINLLRTSDKINSIVTIKSKTSNKDYTYKIVRKQTNTGQTYTHVYVERQYLDFMYLGWFDGKHIMRHRKIQDSESAEGIAWCLRNLYLEPSKVQQNTIWYHTGLCTKCGRTLTDEESIRLGIGPTCRHN